MSEMRKDIFSDEWVVFASNRKDKPYNYKHNKNKIEENCNKICPFCPGNESMTTPTLYELKNEKGWEIRVFENMYPAVSLTDCENKNDGFYESLGGKGIHEIVVDTPEHKMDTSDENDEHFVRLFKVLGKRLELMMKNENVEYVQIFKNNGPFAGASITHSHWQIMSIPVMAHEQEMALKAYSEYKEKNGRCLMCDIIEHERKEKSRMVFENNEFSVFTPYAARQSYELWIVPKRHISTISELTEEEMISLAGVLKDMIGRVNNIMHNISFNICIQETPKSAPEGLFHWYIRILPRLGSWAGFEFATRCFINPVVPEFAAEFYRKQGEK